MKNRETVGGIIAVFCLIALAAGFLIEYEQEIDRLKTKLARQCPNESVDGHKKAETHEYHNRVCILYKDSSNKPAKMVCQYYYDNVSEARM